jgi:hypothetical protein
MPVAVRERAERERGEERPDRAATPSVETPLARPTLLAPATLLRLQAAIGNAAVTGLLDSAQTEKPPEAAVAVANGFGPGAAAATEATAAAPDGTAPAANDAEAPSGAAAPAEEGKAQAPEPPAGGSPASEKTPEAPSGPAGPAPGSESGAKPAAAKEAAAPEAGAKEAAPAGAASGRAPAAPAAGAGGEPAPAGAGHVAQAMPEAAPAAPAGAGARPANPAEHPGFQQAVAQVGHAAATSSAHAPARAKAGEAQAAAVGPANEAASQAKSAQVETMGEAKPKGFDKAAFVRAVQDAVARAAPQNLEEADDFKSSGKAAKVNDEVGGLVGQGKDASRQDIKQATEAPPDASKAKPKEVTPMSEERAGPAPPPVAAAAAMPPAASPAEVNLDQGPAEVNAQMAQANVTEEQLAESNEPQFAEALQSKKQAEVHSAEAPQAYRAQEKDVLAASKGEAETAAKGGLAQMHGKRGAAMGALTAAKGATKTEDETRRAKVATDIEAIYDKTKTEVQQLLDGLDKKVDATFETEEKAAREAFETYVEKRMNAYKSDRYDGVTGGLRWAKDKLFGMPDEVNVFYTEGRNAYLKQMNVVISKVADIVGNDLNAATMRIAQGRAEVAKYVAGLPTDLKKVGAEAQDKIQSKFDELDSDVESKQNELVDTLAQKYAEAQKALDDRINELKEANKGLVNKAIDAVKGAIETILKLKDMLLSVLARAVEAIADIIAHPIRFLENLIGAIKAGLSKFLANIWTHLENALLDWLFGAVASAGLQMPAKLDFKGILDLVLQILGLTYNAIRSRVAKLVGEPVVSRLEQTADVFKALVTEGPVALWKWIQDALSNLADLVLGPIKEFVVERVIKAGITWLIGILNPAAAFIKAAKAIYDIVMFFIERGREIMEFVNSILDSVVSIAKGGVGGVADIIERTLAKILPLAISFLASLLGLGGIGEKVKQIIDTVRKPITKAVDKVVLGAVNWFKKTFGGAARWVKGKVAAGKAWVKGKVEAGKKWVKRKVTSATTFVKKKAGAAASWVAGKLGFATFSARGQKHSLWIDHSAGSPKVVVASTPQDIVVFLDAMEQRAQAIADPGTQSQFLAAVSNARGLSNLVRADAMQVLATPSSQGGQPDRLQARVETLASNLRELLELTALGIHEGTPDDPIPIIFFKSMGRYAPVRLNIRGRERAIYPNRRAWIPAPDDLEGISTGGKIEVGVVPDNHPERMRDSRKVLRRTEIDAETEDARATGEVAIFRELLGHYGFDWGGHAADHMHDLALGGFDQMDNLWPLNASANNAANAVYNQDVVYREGDVVQRSTVGRLRGKWFRISEIR